MPCGMIDKHRVYPELAEEIYPELVEGFILSLSKENIEILTENTAE